MIKDKLMIALDKIGSTNGHAVPNSQDPIVHTLHELYISTASESYFKARKERAKKRLEKQLTPVQQADIEVASKSVKKNQSGTTVQVIDTEHYLMQIEMKNGASFLDTQKLKVELMKKMTATEVEALFEKCTDRRDPSQSWKVLEA